MITIKATRFYWALFLDVSHSAIVSILNIEITVGTWSTVKRCHQRHCSLWVFYCLLKPTSAVFPTGESRNLCDVSNHQNVCIFHFSIAPRCKLMVWEYHSVAQIQTFRYLIAENVDLLISYCMNLLIQSDSTWPKIGSIANECCGPVSENLVAKGRISVHIPYTARHRMASSKVSTHSALWSFSAQLNIYMVSNTFSRLFIFQSTRFVDKKSICCRIFSWHEKESGTINVKSIDILRIRKWKPPANQLQFLQPLTLMCWFWWLPHRHILIENSQRLL